MSVPLLRHLPRERVDERSRAANRAIASSAGELILDRDRRDELHKLAASLDAPLPTVLMAGLAALLFRLASQETVAIGAESRQSPVLFTLAPDSTFEVAVRIAAGHSKGSSLLSEPAEVGFRWRSASSSTEWPLTLTAREEAGLLTLHFSSSTGQWSGATLRAWLGYLEHMLGEAGKQPGRPVSQLPLMARDEVLGFYRDLNRTTAKYPGQHCIHDLFAAQARKFADKIAVICGSVRLTYAEVDARSGELAKRLLALGAGPGRAIAVCMERSAEMPVALLAILKTGACYVPLDPQHPRRRLLTILEECQPAAIVSNAAVAHALDLRSLQENGSVLCVDQPWPVSETIGAAHRAQPDDLAYVIYTSGTTGKPKGVPIAHRSVVNLLCSMQRSPGFRPSDRMLAIATLTFDISALEMFLPLVSGGTVVVGVRQAAADPDRLARLIDGEQITVAQATPVTWRMLVESGWKGRQGLKMISGGEALPRDLANRLIALGGELWNGYGPTETTIYSGMLRIHPEEGIVPIGPPIDNTSFYVVDEAGQALPPGLAGELLIGGDGVAQGYRNRPELTASRFIPDPFGGSGLLFRTGDLVRVVNGREMEFFGRRDHQVKLRGYRIELGEIESILRMHPAVNGAVVVLREDVPGEPGLVAYVTPGEGRPRQEELREHLGALLPAYMVPAQIVVLEALPVTSSGKVDRLSLPAPESVTDAGGLPQTVAAAPPANQTEAKLLGIFQRVLRQPALGVTDSFFDFGGYSLLTLKLFSAIHRELGVRLPISILFDAPTVRQLAGVVRQNPAISAIVPIRPEGEGTPLFVVYSYLLYGALLQIVDPGRPVYGVREPGDSATGSSLAEIAAGYIEEIVRTAAGRPIHLTGWCAAAPLTVEIARQLKSAGQAVGLVALIDAERPGYKPAAKGNRSFWRDRVRSTCAFHARRLKTASWPGRFRYIAEALGRRRDAAIEGIFVRYPRTLAWFGEKLRLALPDAVFNTPWSNIAAVQNHAPNSYPGELTLIRASDVPRLPESDAALGWGSVAQHGVKVVFVEGDHESMFREPHSASLKRELCRALSALEAPRVVHAG